MAWPTVRSGSHEIRKAIPDRIWQGVDNGQNTTHHIDSQVDEAFLSLSCQETIHAMP